MVWYKIFKKKLLQCGIPGRVIFKSLSLSRKGFDFVFDGRYRSEVFYEKLAHSSHHQISTLTFLDRYPLLFKESAEYLSHFQNNPNPKILSFGCSTGEEVLTLGKYFPSAKIIGVDINRWCIRQCRKKNRDSNHSFYIRRSASYEQLTGFDAIFCMAVLQNTDNRTNEDNSIATFYTFSKFEKEILTLHHKLKLNGLFIIENADFSFTDTSIIDHYKPLPFENNFIVNNRPLFGKNNRKISEGQLNNKIYIRIK